MKKSQGTIRVKGRCPICKEKFTEIKGIGYICLEHKTVPKKVWVDFPWKGERIRIFSDKTGKPLDTYSRAEEVLKHLHYELTNHIFDPEKYIKAEASKFWAANLLERFENDRIDNISPKYKKTYQQSIKVAKDFFKIQDVRDIRKVHLIDYVKDCRKNHSKWSDKTLKNHVDVFKTFMNYLHNDLELISAVPTFPVIDYVEKTFKWVSGADQVKLYEMVPDKHKPIIAFLMLHGCRPGEARALKCGDVDLEHACITIKATFSKNVYRLRRKGKKAKAYIIPIHAELHAYIADRVKNSHPESFLFPNPGTGRPYGESVLPKIWKIVRTQAGIGPFELRLYDASRHSFASQLANNGTTLFFVSKALGHSTPKTSERYSHADLEKLRINLSAISLRKKGTVTTLSPGKKADRQKQ